MHHTGNFTFDNIQETTREASNSIARFDLHLQLKVRGQGQIKIL